MAAAAAPPPIEGTPIDPPPPDLPPLAQKLDSNAIGGIAYRTLRRYTYAKVGLLASGTAYYLFLALLSLLALAYGLITLLGADELANRLTKFLNDTLPGLVGPDGIDPDQLRATGATAGIIGLIFMLYGSLAAVSGATSSLHLVYGAPPDPRPFVKAKGRALATLFMAIPLIMASFAATSLTSGIVEPVLNAVGIDSAAARTLVTVTGLLLGYALNVLIIWLLLGRLGGIRPQSHPRLTASLIGAGGALLFQQFLSLIISWSLDKPQYGAFAIPLALLFVMSLLSQVLYGSAALVGGISDADRPLEDLVPTAGKR